MKNACRNFVSLNKLRRQLTKKNITSLLILPVIAAALFATPIAAFASSNARDNNQLRTASPALSPSSSASSPATTPTTPSLASIHMLNRMQGWALAQDAILKTVDGGLHWQDVTPANGFSNVPFMSTPQADFLNAQDAWVVTPVVIPPDKSHDTIRVLRTTDGGKTWQNSIIHTSAGDRCDTPHFLNPSDGWLQTFDENGSSNTAIFHTTDGGLHWNEPGKLNQRYIPDPSGSSFSDNQNGWETGDNPAVGLSHLQNPQPLLEVTHDGGKTWQSQSLAAIPGRDMLNTTPPVFFGNTGFLPVEDQVAPPKKPGIGLDLYVTHNGGQTWTPTPLLTNQGPFTITVDAINSQHVWALLGANLYITSNGGQSWTLLPQPPRSINNLNFIDTNNGWAISSSNAKYQLPSPLQTNQLPSLLQTTNGGHTWQSIHYSIAWKSTTLSQQPRPVMVPIVKGIPKNKPPQDTHKSSSPDETIKSLEVPKTK